MAVSEAIYGIGVRPSERSPYPGVCTICDGHGEFDWFGEMTPCPFCLPYITA